MISTKVYEAKDWFWKIRHYEKLKWNINQKILKIENIKFETLIMEVLTLENLFRTFPRQKGDINLVYIPILRYIM